MQYITPVFSTSTSLLTRALNNPLFRQPTNIISPLSTTTSAAAMTRVFADRVDAANQLAQSPELQKYNNDPNAIAIALPRGGVPMARIINQALNIPMDIIVPRKIGHPTNSEVAVGAITETGVPYWNESYMRYSGLSPSTPAVQRIVQEEIAEANRRLRVYRHNRPALQLNGKTAILVDDGVATGATMKAAIVSARAKHAKRVVVAVPVASPDTVKELHKMADETVCLTVPANFSAVGQFYNVFDQVDDDTVLHIMQQVVDEQQQRQAATTSTVSGADEITTGQSVRVA